MSPDLIDLAGRFVPDMRLLKNVRNEFIVFRDRIFAGDGKQLELSETQLFAMMLYKSTHLSDFEGHPARQEQARQVVRGRRTLVSENIRRVERELRVARMEISRRTLAKQRASRLGKLLVSRIDLMCGTGATRSRTRSIYIDGQRVEPAAFESVEFWRKLASSETIPRSVGRTSLQPSSHRAATVGCVRSCRRFTRRRRLA